MATSTKTDPLKCQLCLKPYKEPFLLPCLHSFCKKCLVADNERQGASETKQQCPSCKTCFDAPPGGVTALPQNFALARQVEMSTIEKKLVSGVKIPCDRCVKQTDGSAVVYCCQCGCFLCSSCKDSHQTWRQMVGHEFVEVGVGKKGIAKLTSVSQISVYCSQHRDEKLKFYCKECEVLSCRDCIVFSHKNHKIRPYEEFIRKGSLELGESLNSSKAMLKKLDKTTTETINMKKRIKSKRKLVDDEINKTFSALSKAVNQRWKVALGECEKLEQSKLQGLDMQLDEFNKFKDAYRYTENALETHQPFELLASKKLIKNRMSHCNESCKKEIVELKEDDVIYTSFNTTALLNEIKYFGLILGIDSTMSHLDTGIAIPLATVNTGRKFSVLVKDSKGNLASSRAVVSASLKNVTSDQEVDITISRGTNSFVLSCTPPTKGEYRLSVSVGHREVKYSPFKFCTYEHTDQNEHFVTTDKLVCDGNACYPRGIAASPDGSVFVFVQNTLVPVASLACIKVFDENGTFKHEFGSHGSGQLQFNNPTKLMILNDVLYVVDTGNGRIQRITLFGKYIGEFCCPTHEGGYPNPQSITHMMVKVISLLVIRAIYSHV